MKRSSEDAPRRLPVARPLAGNIMLYGNICMDMTFQVASYPKEDSSQRATGGSEALSQPTYYSAVRFYMVYHCIIMIIICILFVLYYYTINIYQESYMFCAISIEYDLASLRSDEAFASSSAGTAPTAASSCRSSSPIRCSRSPPRHERAAPERLSLNALRYRLAMR